MNNLTDRENRMLAVMADLDRAASRANTAYFLSPYSVSAAALHEQDMMKALCRVVDALGPFPGLECEDAMKKTETCPVCHGKGKQYDPERGEYTREDCPSCDGTGLPLWKQCSHRRRGEDATLTRLALFLVRITDTYRAYVRGHYAGLNPVQESSYHERRRTSCTSG